jgi:folate-binding protein YgfZ
MKDFLVQNYPDIVLEDNNVKVITDLKEEYLSLRHGVGVRDISDSSFIIMRGIDSFDYLSRISTNSVKDLAVLHKATTLFTNNKGRIIDKAAVIRITDYCFILGGRGSSSRLKSWLERYIINENIKVEDMTGKYSIFELVGPQVESYMNLVFGDVLESIDESLVIISEINEVKIYIAKFKESNGSIKYWLFGDVNFASVIAQYLLDQKSFFDFNFTGEEAFNIYRIEQGIPVYPQEFKDMFTPHELKLMDYVNLQKGSFIGQDIISKSEAYKTTQRELTGVSFENKCDIELPAPIYDENNMVAGMLTSAVYSTSLLKQIGLAIVDKKALIEPKRFTVKDKESVIQFLITANLPFRK